MSNPVILYSGNGVEEGTVANPVRVDPTGATIQPVNVVVALPAGANTIGKVDQGVGGTAANGWFTKITDGTNTATVTAANALKVDGSAVVQPVSGTVTANQGAAAGAAAPWSMRLSDGAAFYDAAKTGQLPAALVGGRLDENVGAWLGSTAPTVGQKTMANSVPVVFASDQTGLTVTLPTVGAQGNAWNAAVVGAGGNSASVDTQYTSHLSIFGNVSALTTITVFYSQDNVNFYAGPQLTVAVGDFTFDPVVGARYVRLKSSAAATITATIAGKV